MRTVLLNRIILILALAGVFVAGALTYSSLANVIVPCGVGDGCKDVANHPSSKWGPIPVAAVGLFAYLVIAAIAIVRMFKGYGSTRTLGLLGYGVTLIGAIVSIGLQIYSISVIQKICSWCLASAIIMVVLFVVQAILYQSEAGAEESQSPPPRQKTDFVVLAVGVILSIAALGTTIGMTGTKSGPTFVAKMEDIPKLVPEGANYKGAKDAPITIVEFGDLCCPACQRAFALLMDIEKAHQGKIKVVFRHFPLYRMHKNSYRAAVYSEYAASEGKFWDFLQAVYTTQPEQVDDEAMLQSLVQGIGLDPVKAEQAYQNEESKEFDRVYRDYELANTLGIKVTPTVFLLVEGERPASMEIGDMTARLDSDPKIRKLLGKP